MKRSAMTRKTPLTRTGFPQTSGHPPLTRNPGEPNLTRSSGIRPTSKKRRAELRQRTEVVAALVESQPWCANCGRTGVPLDPDEIKSRARGGSITDPANIQIICRECHDLKHAELAPHLSLHSWEEAS